MKKFFKGVLIVLGGAIYAGSWMAFCTTGDRAPIDYDNDDYLDFLWDDEQ